MREERDGVDAVGQRTHVRPSRARREPPGLERIRDVAGENRNRGAWQNAAVDEIGRKRQHAATERVDEQELDQVVDRQPEKSVDVAANDPAHHALTIE